MIQQFTQVNIDYDLGGMIPKMGGAPVADCDEGELIATRAAELAKQIVNHTHIPRGSKRGCFLGHDYERLQVLASGVIPRSCLVASSGMAGCILGHDIDRDQIFLKRARRGLRLQAIVTDRL